MRFYAFLSCLSSASRFWSTAAFFRPDFARALKILCCSWLLENAAKRSTNGGKKKKHCTEKKKTLLKKNNIFSSTMQENLFRGQTLGRAAAAFSSHFSLLFQRPDAPFVFPSLFPTRRAKSPSVAAGELTSGGGRGGGRAGRDTDEKWKSARFVERDQAQRRSRWRGARDPALRVGRTRLRRWRLSRELGIRHPAQTARLP